MESNLITEEEVLDLIVREQQQYSEYIKLCQIYQILPDPLAKAFHQSKIQTLEFLIKSIKPTKVL